MVVSMRTMMWDPGEEGVLIEAGVPSQLHRSRDALQVRPVKEENF